MIKHSYIPIVKGKLNDLKALDKLQFEKRELIKPLIELSPTPSQTSADEHLTKFTQNLIKYSGGGELFVDFYGFLPKETVRNKKLATIVGYELLYSAGMQVTPVYGLGRDDLIWSHLEAVVKQNKQGFCFRLEEDDLEEDTIEETWVKVLTKSSQLKLNLDEVDLLIDLRDVREKSIDTNVQIVTDFMISKPKYIKLRSIAIAGSSAPKDVSVIKKDSLGEIERKELKIWANLKTDLVDGDTIIYSDYGVVHPDFAADNIPVGGSANCKIRYTVGNKIMIFRGHKRAGDSLQPHGLAQKVCAHSLYCGRNYSFGDEFIADVANYVKGPGNLGNWVLADMNHHLAFTSTQIHSLRKNLKSGLSQEAIGILLDESV